MLFTKILLTQSKQNESELMHMVDDLKDLFWLTKPNKF